jgi:hypothetical protein
MRAVEGREGHRRSKARKGTERHRGAGGRKGDEPERRHRGRKGDKELYGESQRAREGSPPKLERPNYSDNRFSIITVFIKCNFSKKNNNRDNRNIFSRNMFGSFFCEKRRETILIFLFS